MKNVILAVVLIALCLISTSPSYAEECAGADKKLSSFNFLDATVLIGKNKLDEAQLATYEALNYLSCIKNYNINIVYSINFGVLNLGTIYKRQGLDENKVFALYYEKIGRHIKDVSVELYLFQSFLNAYAEGNITEPNGQFEKNGNICTFTTVWGTIYYGCKSVNRISNSPLLSVSQLNELSLTKVLVNLAYVDNIYSRKTCYEEKPLFESFYGIYPMMVTENSIMKTSTIAPIMSKKLLDKALKISISFDQLAATCKE